MQDETSEYQFGRCLWIQQASEDERSSGFCEACECEITDIRGLSKEEFARRYREGEGKLCVRSSRDQFVSQGQWLKLAVGIAVGMLPLVSGCDSIGNVASTSQGAHQSVKTNSEDVWIGVVVENQPELIGGLSWLQEHTTYPPSALDARTEGRVFVHFTVDENGTTQDVSVTRGLSEACDEEAVRVVQQAEFKPAMQRGKPVQVQMTLPVTFELPESEDT
jgi:TonB family protein